MAYTFTLEDLAGTELGEVAATTRRVGLAVGSMATAGYTLRLDDDLADTILEGDTLLAVYDDDVSRTVPIFHGRQVTAEEVAAENAATVAATYADPSWTLLRRLAGKSAAGYSRGTPLAQVDRGTIIRELVDATNAESPSGVRMGTVTASSLTYVAGWFYKPVAEAIRDLSATLDGPDWRVRPIAYAGGYIGELDVAPAIGQQRPDAAFEYGDGALNVKTYRRAVTLEGTANRLHGLPPGFPDNATQAVQQEDHAASQATRGLLEDALSTDLNVDELRRRLLQHHIIVRHGPRQTITFEPVTELDEGDERRIPRLGLDLNVGDIIPFRATVHGEKRIDVRVRVYGVELADTGAGTLTPTYTVTPTA